MNKKKPKLWIILLCIVLVIAIITGVFAFLAYQKKNKDADDGTYFHLTEAPVGYTPIRTAQDLAAIGNDLSGQYILMNDIDLSEYGTWTPIGSAEKISPSTFTADQKQNYFSGKLNGNGYTIKNMKVDKGSDGGLFSGTVDASVEDLTFDNAVVNIGQNTYGGALSGEMLITPGSQSTISNCHVNSGTILSYTAGGLIGAVYALADEMQIGQLLLQFCSALSNISSVTGGGLVGVADTADGGWITVDNCITDTSVSVHLTGGGVIGNVQNHEGQVLVSASLSEGSVSSLSDSAADKIGAVFGIVLSDAGATTGIESTYFTLAGFPSFNGDSEMNGTVSDASKYVDKAKLTQDLLAAILDFENVWTINPETGLPVLRPKPTLPGGTITPQITPIPAGEDDETETTIPETESEETTTEPSGSGWQQAYKDFLNKQSGIKFELRYIDEDNIPELLTTDEQITHFTEVAIYKYIDGKVVLIDYAGSMGAIYIVEHKNEIHSGGLAMGLEYSTIYKIVGTSLQKTFSYSNDNNQEYKVNDKVVTREEYLAAMNSVSGNGVSVSPSYSLTKDNIDKYVR